MNDLGPQIERVARHLLGRPNKRMSKGDELRFGSNGSLAIMTAGPKAGSWFDHERQIGGGVHDLIKDHGIADPIAFLAELGLARPIAGDIVAAYDYRDESGKLLFQVCRKEPKRFVQRRPDDAGGWVWSTKGVRRVLYRLPELLDAVRKRNGHPPRIFICEGEKDVDRLRQWGLIATTNPGGAGPGKWHADFGKHLAGCEVVILPDNDETGHDHARSVAAALKPYAEIIKVVALGGLDEHGDVSDWIDAGGGQSVLEEIADAVEPYFRRDESGSPTGDDEDDDPIICERLEALSIELIPPRSWAYGHFLLAGYASVLGAVDGGGKGAQAVAIALSMITGRELLAGEKVWRTGPVVLVSYEDDKTEWRRRIAAACLHHGIDYDSVIGSFYFISRPRSQIAFAARLASPRGDSKIGFPDSTGIIAHLKRIKPVLLIVDPFNRAHALEDGNSNVMIALVAGEISRIVAEAGCAGLVLHHLRKGSTGEVDDLMGATALRSTFRATRILMRMTKEEAKGFEIPTAEAWRYSRIASSKENYTKPERARWYVLESVELGNTGVDPIYPDGDSIQVIDNWSPPDAFDGLARTAIAKILTAFRDGTADGEFYSAHGSATHKATDVIIRHGGKTADEARRILNKWKDNGVIADDSYINPQRNRRTRVAVNEAKARDILGPLYQPPEGAE